MANPNKSTLRALDIIAKETGAVKSTTKRSCINCTHGLFEKKNGRRQPTGALCFKNVDLTEPEKARELPCICFSMTTNCKDFERF